MNTFNINDMVYVKLTDKGRAIYREEMERLNQSWPNGKFSTEKEEVDGWSRWQMWDLMNTFGP